MKLTKKEIDSVEIKFDGQGEYGIHNGFFNFIAEIKGEKFDVQACCENNQTEFFASESGFNDGICGDLNENIAKLIGWEKLESLINKAHSEYVEK